MMKRAVLEQRPASKWRPGRVHHAHVREQTNKMKCSLKVSGEDNHTGSQQTMIDEQHMMVWAREAGGVQLAQGEMAV